MGQRLSGLDAAVLASESARIPLHSLALWILDPSTMPSGHCVEALRDGILRGIDLVPRLHRRLCAVPFGLAPPEWIETRVDAGLHVDVMTLPARAGPRQLMRAVADRAERLLERGRPLWQITLIDGLASGSIAALVKLHTVPVDGTTAADLASRIGSGSAESLAEPLAGPQRHPAAVSSPLERLAEALPDIAAQPVQLARAGVRAAQAFARSTLEGDPGVSEVARMAPHTTLNRRSSAHRSVAHASLRMATLREVAERAETGWREVFLAALAGALRSELERTEGALPEPLVACVIDGHRTERAGGDVAPGRLPAMQRRRLFSELPQSAARLSQIAARSTAMAASARPGWPDALTEVLQATSPLMFSLLSGASSRLGLASRAAPPFHLLVSFLEGPGKRTFIGGARLEHVHPLHPIVDGVNLHVAAWHNEAALDVGILACRRFMPDAWPLAAALSDALAELDGVSLAASGQ